MPLWIRNVVASVTVAEVLRLNELATTIRGAEFDRTFPKIIIRLSVPKATALIFRSGKIVLTGLRSSDTIGPALAAVLDVLQGGGAEIAESLPAPKLVNLVASGTLGERVALHRLAISRNLDRIEFDPEQFPGLVYRSEAGPVALVFGTGSIVITGARSLEGAQAVAAEVQAMVAAAGAWSRSEPGTSGKRVRQQRQRSH